MHSPTKNTRAALEAVKAWRNAETWEAASAGRETMKAATGGAVTLDRWGSNGVSIDLAKPARGLGAGAVAKVYLNEYGKRGDSPSRLEAAAALAVALGAWANAAAMKRDPQTGRLA